MVWEYNVAGYMRYEIPVISKAVDGVIGLQAAALADLLGRVDAPTSAAAKEETKPAADEKPADKRAAPPPEKPAGAPAKPAAASKPKLDEAFGDLIGD